MNEADKKAAQQAKSSARTTAATATPPANNQEVFRNGANAIAGAGASLGQMSGTVADQVSNSVADRTTADIILLSAEKINGMLSGRMEPLPLTQQAMSVFMSGFTQVSEQLVILEATDPKQLGSSEYASLPYLQDSVDGNKD